jgi:predicted transcriptional regulator
MMIHTNSDKNLPWQQTAMLINSTIEQAVQILNQVGLKIVLITDKNGVLQGTISDGDIRRGLMNGLTLSSSIEKIQF